MNNRPRWGIVRHMQRIIVTLGLVLATTATPLAVPFTPPAAAEQGGDMREGLDLMQEGMRLLMDGMMAEVAPTLDELRGAFRDLGAYHPPEILPNGDILIRRRVPLDPAAPKKEGAAPLNDTQIEL